MNMAEGSDDAVIVCSTIDLGHNLGLEVVAEGVESQEALATLTELGCDTVQGYFLGRRSRPRRSSGSCAAWPGSSRRATAAKPPPD